MNIALLLERTARVSPLSPAVFSGTDLVLTYQELASRSISIASALLSRGLKAGDHVAICSINCPEYLEILYGIWYAGLVAVPINAKLHPREIEYILDNSNSRTLFCSQNIASQLKDGASSALSKMISIEIDSTTYQDFLIPSNLAMIDRGPSDLAWIFYTSGTTGRPKGVMLSHQNILSMTLAYFSDVDSVESSNSSVYAAPMSHGAGFYNFPHVLKGAKHVIPNSGGFEPTELAELALAHQEISMFAAPTMIKRLIDYLKTSSKRNLISEGFKTIVYGGGPMYNHDLKDALEIMGTRFVQIYGQGESPMTITSLSKEVIRDSSHPNWENRISSVGKAQSIVEIKIADQDGKELPIGAIGEVLVKGPTVMQGYLNNSEATSQSIKEQWLFTGDMGALDHEGFLTLKDRSKDLIISGGSNIYPREVEEVLLQHPHVSETSVIGIPDSDWGEIVLAIIVQIPSSKLSNEELQNQLDKLCLDQIARFKRPKKYLYMESLPKNNYGKVLKTELRLIAEKEFPIA